MILKDFFWPLLGECASFIDGLNPISNGPEVAYTLMIIVIRQEFKCGEVSLLDSETYADIDRDQFRTSGYLGPIDLMTPAEMAELRPSLEQVLRTVGSAPTPPAGASDGRLAQMLPASAGGSPVPFIECRHLDTELVLRLATHPVLLGVARSLYGEDLVLWRSTFILKGEGGPSFRWHQDWGGVFGRDDPGYGLEPPMSFSFWIAITEAAPDNGCMRFVPGVRRVLPSMPAGSGPRATLLTDPAEVDESKAVDMPLQPGQCVVFTDRALHSSWTNVSGVPRLALAVRFTVPSVRVRPHFPGHACVLVSGRDTVGLNALVEPPWTD